MHKIKRAIILHLNGFSNRRQCQSTSSTLVVIKKKEKFELNLVEEQNIKIGNNKRRQGREGEREKEKVLLFLCLFCIHHYNKVSNGVNLIFSPSSFACSRSISFVVNQEDLEDEICLRQCNILVFLYFFAPRIKLR